MIARSYAAAYELPVAVTRLATVYGPGDVNWGRLVPETARAPARRAPGDPLDLDSTAIREELGLDPERDLDRGLRAAWGWCERTLRS
jgi:CDP-glucose 4,6-dehydratase